MYLDTTKNSLKVPAHGGTVGETSITGKKKGEDPICYLFKGKFDQT